MSNNCRSIAIISNQAFSLINFRGSLIKELINKGVVVHALAPDFTELDRLRLRSLGAQTHDCYFDRTGINPFNDFLTIFKLTILLRRLKPDATLSYFIKPVLYGTIASWIAGIKFRYALIEGLGYVFSRSAVTASYKKTLIKNIVLLLYTFSLGRSTSTVVLNKDDLSELVDNGVIERSKIRVVDGIGVDINRLEYSIPPTNPVVFILIARMLYEKGVLEYVEAARIVQHSFPAVRFELIGGTDTNPQAIPIDFLKSLASEGIVTWHGHVSNVSEHIKKSSVFVLPSYYREGLPRSTQEAMAVGRPIITTDVPGCRETVFGNLNGILIEPRSVSSLVSAMLFFLNNPNMIEKMGLESRRIAETRFDERKINKIFMSIIGVH